MKNILSIFLTGCSISLQSCVTTQVARLGSDNSPELPVYVTSLPEKPYKELSYIEASGSIFHTKQQLLNNLKAQALNENADGLVAVRFGYAGWLPYAEGICFKLNETAR